jgi:crotonobetainyl-CoA:carnitine CoA-transferase CaiB-like acyl-CoA transferase
MGGPERSYLPEVRCPLDGVRVVDVPRPVSGKMVSLQLGDFGAEIIKIEDPQKGDPMRARLLLDRECAAAAGPS